MSYFTNLKYLAVGSLTGLLANIYFISIVEQRMKVRKNELNRLKLLYKKNLDLKINHTHYQNRDIIFSILFNSYITYIASGSLIFIKFLTSNDKHEKIQNFIYENIFERC